MLKIYILLCQILSRISEFENISEIVSVVENKMYYMTKKKRQKVKEEDTNIMKLYNSYLSIWPKPLIEKKG